MYRFVVYKLNLVFIDIPHLLYDELLLLDFRSTRNKALSGQIQFP